MNVLTIFDQRISAIFEEGAPGSKQPLSFKRLAKRAVREMEDETFVIDGVDTAPALYTILVSQDDNDLMLPLYMRIADEISQLIEAQAKKRGYTFVGRPLARFMVDPALRHGRFSVFAENIDPRTLARLRDEEEAYLSASSKQQVVVEQGFAPSHAAPQQDGFAVQPEPVEVVAGVADPADALVNGASDGLDVMEEPQFAASDVAEPVAEAAAVSAAAAVADVVPEDVVPSVAIPEAIPADVVPEAAPAAAVADVVAEDEPFAPADVPEPTSAAIAADPFAAPADEQPQAPVDPLAETEPEVDAPPAPACTLTDQRTGRVYRVTTERALIGRDVSIEGVVVLDPNASRRHAELWYDGTGWSIRDLASTNGTLVNDSDVTEAGLRNGDVLTIGLTNLEFREG